KNTFQVNLENMDSNFSQENITNDYGDDALSVFSDNQPVTETSAENQELHFEEQEQHSEEEQEQHSEEDQRSTKRQRTAHPLWNYFNWSQDKNYYNRIQQSTLLIQNVVPYGSHDERKVKRLNGLLIR
ncbi:20163_t:CDS:2, partial [Gigaspora rosea]